MKLVLSFIAREQKHRLHSGIANEGFVRVSLLLLNICAMSVVRVNETKKIDMTEFMMFSWLDLAVKSEIENHISSGNIVLRVLTVYMHGFY